MIVTDPTPTVLRPLQQMIAQILSQKMSGQWPTQPMPTFGSAIPSVIDQIYGTGGTRTDENPVFGAPPPRTTPPPPVLQTPNGPMPVPDQNPWVPNTPGLTMPLFGDAVSSGSRFVRSYQPQYFNQYTNPNLEG
jgi:hypothetical protein